MTFTGFEGEQYHFCHHIRNGKHYPSPLFSRTVDVVIVGAGISGLISAYTLQKQGKQVLIIEKESRVGGASKRGNWNNIYYSYGAADTAESYEITYQGTRLNFLQDFYDELLIPWKKVPEPSFAFMYKNQLFIHPFSENSSNDSTVPVVEKSFKEGYNRLEHILTRYGKPVIPAEASPAGCVKLDQTSLHELFNGVSSPFLVFLNRFSLATFGAPATEVSGFVGVYYLAKEFEQRYTCPGGNACVAEALASHLTENIELNSTVIDIEYDPNFCYVTYLTANNQPIKIKTTAVIYAAEKHYVPYIIHDIPMQQHTALKNIRYSSFIVANICTKDVVYDSAFATYFDDAFFADMVVADWITAHGHHMNNHNGSHVYTLYCPLGDHQRAKLLQEPASTWIRLITNDFEHFFPESSSSIVDIRLLRYGHHYVVGHPGFIFTNRTIAFKPIKNIFFAKDDTQGIPSLESAVWSGLRAAQQTLAVL